MMGVLHVFDLDGTLLRGSTASVELARVLGLSAELALLEGEFRDQKITTRDFAERIFALWGSLTSAQVGEAFQASPWILGIAEVFDDISSRGERSLVITMSPDFFANLLSQFGAHEIAASRFPQLPFTGSQFDLSGILCADDKVTITRDALARHGINAADCIAYGDSLSDVPLFSDLTKTVAVNADSHLKAIAGIAYDGDDLQQAYSLARSKYLIS